MFLMRKSLQRVGAARSHNQRFLLTPKEKKYPEKVISFTIQTNINLDMFQSQFLVKTKIYI